MTALLSIRRALADLEHEAVTHLNEWANERPEDGTGGELSEKSAIVFRKAAIEAFAEGHGTWRALAMDRLMNAFAEKEPEEMRDALLDAAGLLVAWVADLEQRPRDGVRHATGSGARAETDRRA